MVDLLTFKLDFKSMLVLGLKSVLQARFFIVSGFVVVFECGVLVFLGGGGHVWVCRLRLLNTSVA